MEGYRHQQDIAAGVAGPGMADHASNAPMVVSHEHGYQYSDYPQAAYDYSAYKEAVQRPQYPSETYPEAVNDKAGMAGAGAGVSPAPPGYAELSNGNGGHGEAGYPVPPLARTATICGMRRRTFWIVMGIAVVVVVAGVVGGVVGSGAAKRNGQEPVSKPPAAPANSNSSFPAVLTGSKIAASNWTGHDGYGRRAVFFQDTNNALLARLWDSQNTTWLTHNISDIFTQRNIDIAIAPTSSLASAALDTVNAFGPRLWFLNKNNIVQRVESSELDVAQQPDSWTANLPDGPHTVWPGSQLAAAWQRCAPNCVGNWVLAYQRNTDGAIVTANNSHWANPDLAIKAGEVSKSTAIALVPWYQGIANKMGLMSESKVSSGNADVQLYALNTSTGDWANTGKPLLASSVPSATSETQFAVTKWDNWSQSLYLSLTANGKLSASWWHGPQTVFEDIALTGFSGNSSSGASGNGTPQITAITLTLDAMFYGVTADGMVLEYKVDQDSPGTFTYVSTVWPPKEGQ